METICWLEYLGATEAIARQVKSVEPPAANDPDQSGARNPLDRVCDLCRCSGDSALVAWLCQKADGFFVRNPKTVPPEKADLSVIDRTQEIINTSPKC
jgi:hypothetical protein